MKYVQNIGKGYDNGYYVLIVNKDKQTERAFFKTEEERDAFYTEFKRELNEYKKRTQKYHISCEPDDLLLPLAIAGGLVVLAGVCSFVAHIMEFIKGIPG